MEVAREASVAARGVAFVGGVVATVTATIVVVASAFHPLSLALLGFGLLVIAGAVAMWLTPERSGAWGFLVISASGGEFLIGLAILFNAPLFGSPLVAGVVLATVGGALATLLPSADQAGTPPSGSWALADRGVDQLKDLYAALHQQDRNLWSFSAVFVVSNVVLLGFLPSAPTFYGPNGRTPLFGLFGLAVSLFWLIHAAFAFSLRRIWILRARRLETDLAVPEAYSFRRPPLLAVVDWVAIHLVAQYFLALWVFVYLEQLGLVRVLPQGPIYLS